MEDFPFTTWDTYYEALTMAFNGSIWLTDKFPAYNKYTQEYGFEGDLTIMNDLLTAGLDPQQGLDGFVQACLNGDRYANELNYNGTLPDVLQIFLQKGAKLNGDCLFELKYPEHLEHFDDEVNVFSIRGGLIDAFYSLGYDVGKYYDWASIPATYWEDISEENVRHNYKKACFMALKETSKVLKGVE